MADRDPLPEGWVDVTHPDGSGEVARVRVEYFDAVLTHKGWVDVHSSKGKELVGGDHAPIDPLLANEPDEVKKSARRAAAKASGETSKSSTTSGSTTGGSS